AYTDRQAYSLRLPRAMRCMTAPRSMTLEGDLPPWSRSYFACIGDCANIVFANDPERPGRRWYSPTEHSMILAVTSAPAFPPCALAGSPSLWQRGAAVARR